MTRVTEISVSLYDTISKAGVFWQALARHGGNSGFRRNDHPGMLYGHRHKIFSNISFFGPSIGPSF
jgi:hypothetical protein